MPQQLETLRGITVHENEVGSGAYSHRSESCRRLDMVSNEPTRVVCGGREGVEIGKAGVSQSLDLIVQ